MASHYLLSSWSHRVKHAMVGCIYWKESPPTRSMRILFPIALPKSTLLPQLCNCRTACMPLSTLLSPPPSTTANASSSFHSPSMDLAAPLHACGPHPLVPACVSPPVPPILPVSHRLYHLNRLWYRPVSHRRCRLYRLCLTACTACTTCVSPPVPSVSHRLYRLYRLCLTACTT